MKKMLTRALAVSSTAAFSALALNPAVFAETSTNSTQQFQTSVKQVNNSGVSGMVTATLDGNKLTIKENLTGELKGQAHAQHLHFSASATHTCPTDAVIKKNKPGDKNDKPFAFGNDKVLESVEAESAIGAPVISLTTTGDTSAKSALASKRFPVANKGVITYKRTITLSQAQVKELKAGQLVFETHGIDLNGNGKYDVFGKNKDLTRSPMAASMQKKTDVPLEETAPAGCGVLTSIPAGAPSTGDGGTAGIEKSDLFVLGGIAVVLAGVTFALSQPKISRK